MESINEPILANDEELVDLDLDEELASILFYALDEACSKISDEEELVPFTVILAGEDLFFDSHPYEDEQECYDSAAESVNMIAHLADAYVFCYDGFIDTDDEEHDMIIAELGRKYEDDAVAYGLVYEKNEEENTVAFDEGLIALGEVDNLFDPDQVAAAEAIQAAYAEAAAAEADSEADVDDEERSEEG